nr:sulfurtransferase [Propionibacterium sp.]
MPVVVDAAWLADHPEVVLCDVRWYLDGRDGRTAYLSGHLPGAVFVDLDAHLAAPASVEGGRHPLPAPEVFAEGMRAAGISDDSVVVGYDDAGGAVAGRLVWLLRALGVDAAVLDGGLAAWRGPLAEGPEDAPARGDFTARPWAPADLATIDDACTAPLVLDARAPERYRGETEPVDARAGHIPGALSAFFGDNLNPDKTFRSPAELRRRFAALGVTDATDVVCYCGSGVNACHNLIALEHAGLGRGRLYPGSWSQYAATERPAATGPEPGGRPAIDPHGVTH